MNVKNKIKVLQFTDTLSDGGAETIIKEYVTKIDKQKFEIKVVTVLNLRNTANYKAINEEGVQILSIYRNMNLVERIIHKTVNHKYIEWKFRKIIEDEKPNCIHVHMWLLKYFKNIDLKGIKIFYTCHSLPERYFGKGNREEYESAKKLIVKYNMTMIALHDDMAKELNELFNIDTTVAVRNGIDVKRFVDCNVNRKEIRKSINIDTGAFVLGHIGRFAEVKNHRLIIDVFYELLDKMPSACLLLIGDGGLRGQVEKRLVELNIYDKVRILEHRDDVPELLKAMDFFIFPSKYEGLGIVLIEAQTSGLPCIISDRIPKDAIISSNVTVRDLEDSPKEWVESILKKRTDKCEVDSEKYDINTIIKQIEKMYGEE